ncbi:type IV secretion system protein [Phenylobacterium immobile]|uniref:type IV secretion system protein n=1 Tax=Phenylobacterium immobile TaxID=21 RepID=UPI000B051323|nr:type IV secretion system protein [Phenylobacterium immobile]
MSGCEALVQEATAGVAASLRAVDCVSAETTTSAFSRLFGTHGALLPVLTILLTLYVATFAVLLLTGRSRLSITTLTPRMITLGLVLTFTTSAVAYQTVFWNLTVGGPDQIAGVLMGARGSATQMFGDRIDILFNAIAEAASAASPTAGAGAGTAGTFTSGNLMWISALMLLLGTVGVLVTARIVLAVLLAIGPVFIVLALFPGTRGLFAGWLRGLVLTAFTPLIAVLAGASVTELAAPVVATLRGGDGIDGRAAIALFVIAAVYCSVMALALRVAGTMVAGWRVFGLSNEASRNGQSAPPTTAIAAASTPYPVAPASNRLQTLAAAAGTVGPSPAAGHGLATTSRSRIVATAGALAEPARRSTQPQRARGIGSRFSSRATAPRNFLK